MFLCPHYIDLTVEDKLQIWFCATVAGSYQHTVISHSDSYRFSVVWPIPAVLQRDITAKYVLEYPVDKTVPRRPTNGRRRLSEFFCLLWGDKNRTERLIPYLRRVCGLYCTRAAFVSQAQMCDCLAINQEPRLESRHTPTRGRWFTLHIWRRGGKKRTLVRAANVLHKASQ